MKGFRKYNLFVNESCYNCKYKGKNRLGDITLGDFWGLKNGQFTDNKGVSLVILNSDNGTQLFNDIQNQIIYERHRLIETMRNDGLWRNIEKKQEFYFWKKNENKIKIDKIIKKLDKNRYSAIREEINKIIR